MKTIFAAFALTFAASAYAADDEYVLTYSADDFQSVETVKDLYQRVRNVARNHCPSYFRSRDLAGTTACVDDVVNDLIDNINHPALSAYQDGEDDVRVEPPLAHHLLACIEVTREFRSRLHRKFRKVKSELNFLLYYGE